MKQKELDSSFTVLIALVLMVSLIPSQLKGGFGILSHMSEDLGIGIHESTGYLFAGYTLGLTLGQLIVGPLADRFGRLPIFIIFLNIFSASSLLCALFHMPELFQFFRIISGFTISAGVIVSRSIISDHCNITKGSKILSKVKSISFILIAFYPFFITLCIERLHLGWRSFFVINSIFCSLVSATSYHLLAKIGDNTDKKALSKKNIQNNINNTLNNRVYLGCVLVNIVIILCAEYNRYQTPLIILDYFDLSTNILNLIEGPVSSIFAALALFINAHLIKNDINPVDIILASVVGVFALIIIQAILSLFISDKNLLLTIYILGYSISIMFYVISNINTFMIATHNVTDAKVGSGFITSLTVSLISISAFLASLMIPFFGDYGIKVVVSFYGVFVFCMMAYTFSKKSLFKKIVSDDS